MLQKPAKGSYNSYYEKYIDALDTSDIFAYLEHDMPSKMRTLLSSLTADQLRFRYAEGKWSLAEVVGHIIDCERVFAYRALAFSRGDKTPLAGFEEDDYAANSNYNEMDGEKLAAIYQATRRASLELFFSFSENMWQEVGNANGDNMICGAIPYVIAGHETHHMQVIRDRYLK